MLEKEPESDEVFLTICNIKKVMVLNGIVQKKEEAQDIAEKILENVEDFVESVKNLLLTR